MTIKTNKPVDALFSIKREEEQHDNGDVTVTVTPPSSIFKNAKGKSVRLTPDQYLRYAKWASSGVLIQEALPELTPVQREILINGDPDYD